MNTFEVACESEHEIHAFRVRASTSGKRTLVAAIALLMTGSTIGLELLRPGTAAATATIGALAVFIWYLLIARRSQVAVVDRSKVRLENTRWSFLGTRTQRLEIDRTAISRVLWADQGHVTRLTLECAAPAVTRHPVVTIRIHRNDLERLATEVARRLEVPVVETTERDLWSVR